MTFTPEQGLSLSLPPHWLTLKVLDLSAFVRANSYFYLAVCLSVNLSIINPIDSVSNAMLFSAILYHLSLCSHELQRSGHAQAGHCAMEVPFGLTVLRTSSGLHRPHAGAALIRWS